MRVVARNQQGFTLTEIMVASAIFLFIALAAFSVFTESNRIYKSGDSQAEMQQRTRLTFEVMLDELRLAGFDYNQDGDENEYPDHPDEQIEYVAPHAITFRANLDQADGNGGRETHLEMDPSDPEFGRECCPIVTTGNDEIVTYALRSDDTTRNTDDIVFVADVTAPRDGSFDDAGLPEGEETITIENVDLSGNNPPYTLMRFSLDAGGLVVEAPVATNVRNLTFTFESADGTDYHCLSLESDGTCATGNRVAFSGLAGEDDINIGDGRKREARAGIRSLNVELIGMSERDERGFVDRNDSRMPGRRKLALSATVVPQNLGLMGQPDIDDRETLPPTNVTLCAGQCNTVRVEWDEAERASGYVVKLFLTGQITPFFTGATPGVRIPGSNPMRVYAIFQRKDSASLVNGTTLFARVASRVSGDRTSDDSDASTAVVLSDVTKLEEPKNADASGYDPTVTGWPDIVGYSIPPITTPGDPHCARENAIVVTWDAPIWALQVTDQANPATTWTTRVGSGTAAPIACDSEEDPGGEVRTRARDQFGTTRYLIFRSTNPRFVPTAADFVAATPGDVDIVQGRVSFRDETIHNYTNGVFNATPNPLKNCATYYYRVRAVDDCWDGTNPAGSSLNISPFSPRLHPDATAPDSDDVSGIPPDQVSLAIPGFAIPKAAPKPPQNVRFTRYDRRNDDGDERDAVIGFDATKMDTFTSNGDPAWDDITIAQYRVYSAPQQSYTLADCKTGNNGAVLEAVVDLRDLKAGRIAYDDENGDGSVSTAEDETLVPSPWPAGASPVTGLRIDLGNGSNQRWYRVVALQCTSENTVPSDYDYESFDWSDVSPAIKFPCEFGGGPFSTITASSAGFPGSASCDAVMELDTVAGTNARLVLKDAANGDRTMTPYPGVAVTNLSGGVRRATFSAADIARLTDNFGSGSYRVSCEMDDSNGCLGISDSQDTSFGTGSCCLAAYTIPAITKVNSLRSSNTVIENCNIQLLRIRKITVTIDNLNGGAPERLQAIQWNNAEIWTGNVASAIIDRTANPLTLYSLESGTLTMDYQRNVSGDNVTVTYEYKIGGLPGTCTFTSRMP